MGSLPSKWRKVNEPEAGSFTLVMISGYIPIGGTTEDHVPIYVCTSDEGYLSESFAYGDPAWEIYSNATKSR